MSEQQMAGLPEGPWVAEYSDEYGDWTIYPAGDDEGFARIEPYYNGQQAEAIAHHLAASWQTARDLRTALRFITEVHAAWRAWRDGEIDALADMGPAFDAVMAELMPERTA